MALAEPALRQFGFQKLRNVRARGGSLLGTAIGTAVGIGYGLAKNYDFTFPWDTMEQPGGSRRPFVGDVSNGQTPSHASSYKQYQAFRRKNTTRRSKRNKRHDSCCKCC